MRVVQHREIEADYGDNATRILLAVLADPFPMVTTVTKRTGLPKSTVHSHLNKLARDGLVTYDCHKQGTLRARVRVVA